MGVLDKGAGVAVEVDRLARVEEHRLARIDLQNKIFQCAEAHHVADVGDFPFAQAVELAQLLRHFAGRGDHLADQVVGVHHRSFARFHLAFG